jgi:hypothetical protein
MTVTSRRPATKGLVAILLSLIAAIVVVDMARVDMTRVE